MIDIRSLAKILVVIGLSSIISGTVTLAYIVHETDIVDSYVNKINELEKENTQLKRDYNYEKREKEYWYYECVNDAY